MSGAPQIHDFIDIENSLCDHRLFSLHGSYQSATMHWVNYVRSKVEVDPAYKYPKTIMLDSGAFTAWNMGHITTVDEVNRAYSHFMSEVGDLFDDIVMINLDRIPGEKGRDPTLDELKEAVEISDENYKILRDIFGDKVLPVFHQGEPDERLYEVAEMTQYICLSPRNDLHEKARRLWSQERHALLHEKYPTAQTHGLATTGNLMLRDVPWHSVDSASWVHHAAYGMIDIFLGNRYKGFFVSNEGGKQRQANIHIGAEDSGNISPTKREYIERRATAYGVTMKQLIEDFSARKMVCLGELATYARWATEYQNNNRITTQRTLLGEM